MNCVFPPRLRGWQPKWRTTTSKIKRAKNNKETTNCSKRAKPRKYERATPPPAGGGQVTEEEERAFWGKGRIPLITLRKGV
jgi:hypothetical protein